MRAAILLALVACGPPPRPQDTCTAPYTDQDRYARIPVSGYDPTSLKDDMGSMRARIPLSSAPESPASMAAFEDASRSQGTAHYLEAARAFRGIALDDTTDLLHRQLAQYFFAVDLHSLKLDTEARMLFRDIASTPGHPKHESAVQWLVKTYCE